MQSYNIRSIVKPVLIVAGAAFLFVTAGCGRQSVTTPPGTTSSASSSTSSSVSSGTKTTAPGKTTPPPTKVDQGKQSDEDAEHMKEEEQKILHLEASNDDMGTTWVENGVVRMKAKADRAHYDGLHRMGSFTNFSATLYENGKPTTTMTAPRVIGDVVNKTITADGGVEVRSLDGQNVVKSKWMKWFSREQRVVGGGKVVSKTGPWQSTGPGFVADTGLKSVTVRPLVKGQDF